MKHKKILAVIFLCLILICPVVLAAGQPFYFDEPVFNVTIPDGFLALTRDISPDDEALGILAIGYDEFINNMINKRVYLSAIRPDPFAEINVALWRDDFSKKAAHFKNLTDAELDSRALEYMEQKGENESFRFASHSIYRTGDEAYLVFDIEGEADGQSMAGRQYQTVYDGACVAFTIITASQALSDGNALTIRGMVDSCVFGEEKKGSAFANVMLVVGMFVIGAATMLAARRRSKKLESERKEKRRKRRLSTSRPAYCPNCGAKMELGHTICGACGARGESLNEKRDSDGA